VKRHGAYSRPGAIDPWWHNRIVARRKKYRRIARELRTSTQGTTRAFLDLAAAADRAADSLRRVRDAFARRGRL
jgi:hypothetical protein